MAKPRIAAVGAGRMGRGLAHVFAYAGHDFALIDAKSRPPAASERLLGEAQIEIAATLGMMADFGKLDTDRVEETLARVSYYAMDAAPRALAEADYIFEGVTERLDAKEAAFDFIGRHARPEAIVSSTTSTMLVDELAGFVTKPERFLNGHWLNPAFLIPLVEVSPGGATAPETVESFTALLESVGKVPVVCAAKPGFIVPRIQALAMAEAARLVEEGVASPEEIDRAARVGFGVRFAILGLVEFIDWGGNDILHYASKYLKNSLGSDRYTNSELSDKMMAAGNVGMKSGEAFYDFKGMDVAAYQRETLRKFVDLLDHLGLVAPAGGVPEGAQGPAARTRGVLKAADLSKYE